MLKLSVVLVVAQEVTSVVKVASEYILKALSGQELLKDVTVTKFYGMEIVGVIISS